MRCFANGACVTGLKSALILNVTGASGGRWPMANRLDLIWQPGYTKASMPRSIAFTADDLQK